MVSGEIGLGSPPAKRVFAAPGLNRLALIPIIVGLLAVASILLLIYQENRAVQYGIEAAEGWSAYQVKIVQSTSEEDPNLKAQYTEEQDVLRRHGQDLKEKSGDASRAAMFSTYAALLLLLGAGTAVFALVANRIHSSYAGLLLGIIGVGLGIRALF
jgi:Flp pilus assembly protein TadB